jgi:nitrogen regulatory protein PII
MTKREITVLTDVALITCIVQRGVANKITDAAREAGAQGATVHFAKGMGVRERLGILGLAVEVEKEIVQIMVSTDQVDHVFEKIYLAGELDTPGMGIMFITPLEKAATYIPHDVLEKLARGEGAAPGTAEESQE